MEQKLKKDEVGLSDGNRNLIVILVVILLLIFGPIEPYGMVFRSVYLIIIPALIWLVLRYWGKKWGMDELTNDHLNRAIFALVAGMLLAGAYFSLTIKTHLECEQYTRDGECVGDYVKVKGPDKSRVIISIIFASTAFWLAISKRIEKE